MNYGIIGYVLVRLLRLEAGLLSLPLLVALIYQESWVNIGAFGLSIVLLLLVSLFPRKNKNQSMTFYMREAFIIVGLSWILLSFFGSLPFYLSGEIPSLVDAFFETSSGFTTTGSSILVDVEALSKSMLFWRSFTHMIGGMGILIFALAVLPKMASDGVRVAKAEVPGPSFGKLVSKLSLNAKILYIMYIAMTGVVVVFLLLGGMSLFDALIHAFGAAGTGGFSNKVLSVGFYNSRYIEAVLGISMLIFGMNFNLHYIFLFGNKREILKNEELKWYLVIVFLAIIFIGLNIKSVYGLGQGLRHSFFAVSSVITTTGYATVDFAKWPLFSRLIIMVLMVVGGCAGSTSGGLKVSRVVVLVKSGLSQIIKSRQPGRVQNISYEGEGLSEGKIISIQNYFMLYMLVLTVLILLLSFNYSDLETAISGALTAFNNIGPGLGQLGPSSNFSSLSDFNKLVMSLAMIAGRLEILPIIVVFMPSSWKKLL
ncbi:MAG: TrkH family potassium uptake protein [Tissierellia bacterium]|nr:TrkH family potassium uptake protein [Tissierellia bacterium]